MHHRRTTPITAAAVLRLLATGFAALVGLVVLAGPAGAQYGGGGVQVFLDQVRVPIDEPFGVFGRDCPAGSTVEITIDGVPGVLATTTASAGGFYTASDIPLPDGLEAGSDYTVRATCEANTATALMTLVCHSGDDPVDGSCEDGSDGLVGGSGPTTTTTTIPVGGGDDGGGDPGGSDPDDGGSGGTSGGGSDDGSDPGGDGSNPNAGDGGGGDGLAFTGASFSELLVQIGVSLFALGFVFVILARRRTPADPYA
ncbi:MAG: hypothetical protein AAGE98_19025 [Actinomycetota bacterium]